MTEKQTVEMYPLEELQCYFEAEAIVYAGAKRAYERRESLEKIDALLDYAISLGVLETSQRPASDSPVVIATPS